MIMKNIYLLSAFLALFFFQSCNFVNTESNEDPVNRLKPEDVDEHNVAGNDEDDVYFNEEDLESLPGETATGASKEPTETTTKRESSSRKLDSEFTEKSGYNGGAEEELLVVVGSYSLKANAETMVDQLKAAGYENAQIVIFREKEFHSVIAGSFNKLEEAQSLVNSLKKEKGISAYIHKKRYGDN